MRGGRWRRWGWSVSTNSWVKCFWTDSRMGFTMCVLRGMFKFRIVKKNHLTFSNDPTLWCGVSFVFIVDMCVSVYATHAVRLWPTTTHFRKQQQKGVANVCLNEKNQMNICVSVIAKPTHVGRNERYLYVVSEPPELRELRLILFDGPDQTSKHHIYWSSWNEI